MPTYAERKQYYIDRHTKYRSNLLKAYGGECLKCGYSDPRALQIDHITGGGRRGQSDRRKDGINAVTFMKHLMQEMGSGLYHLLCANCNWIKRHEHGECKGA